MPTAIVALLYGVVGCGGGSSSSSIPTTNTGTQNSGATPTQEGGSSIGAIGSLYGGVGTTDAALSTNGARVPVVGATVVINNANGDKVTQTSSNSVGGFTIYLIPAGTYTIVPLPFKVGDVTLTAPSLQVTLSEQHIQTPSGIDIIYQRQQ